MGILLIDSFTDPITGTTKTNAYASFDRETVKVRYNYDSDTYTGHGVARLFWSMIERSTNLQPIKRYVINTPAKTLREFNDQGLYTLLYEQLKLESDFSSNTINDVPNVIFGVATAAQLVGGTIHIPQSTVISDSVNSDYIVDLIYTIENGFSTSVLGEEPSVTFEEIFAADTSSTLNLQLENLNLNLDTSISPGVTSTARVITEVGKTMGLPFANTAPSFLNSGHTHTANITIRATSVNPNKTFDYTYTITSDFLPFTSISLP